MPDQNNSMSRGAGPLQTAPQTAPLQTAPQTGPLQTGPLQTAPQTAPPRSGPAWQVQDAKARFSELLDASLSEGPQIITRRGTEIAAVVPIEQWRRLESAAPSLQAWLLEPGARTQALAPPRKKRPLRPVRRFE